MPYVEPFPERRTVLPHQGWPASEIDTSTPHPARVYDYFLGGKDNYPVDGEAAEAILRDLPFARTIARQNRAFMRRAAHVLAAEAGIRQFLDIGTGIPTSPNLHEVVQAVEPTCRVIYVDNDPAVLVHARALLTGSSEGETAYVHADLRDIDSILTAPALRETFDLTAPVALTLISVLHFVPLDDPYATVNHLLQRLPSGSYLALSYATPDLAPEEMQRAQQIYNARGMFLRQRPKAEIEEFFTGLELLEPGVVPLNRWRPDNAGLRKLPDSEVSMYGGVARKN